MAFKLRHGRGFGPTERMKQHGGEAVVSGAEIVARQNKRAAKEASADETPSKDPEES